MLGQKKLLWKPDYLLTTVEIRSFEEVYDSEISQDSGNVQNTKGFVQNITDLSRIVHN